MDETETIPSEDRSMVGLGEKRPFEDQLEAGLGEKRLFEDRLEVGLGEKRPFEDRSEVGLGEKGPFEDRSEVGLGEKRPFEDRSEVGLVEKMPFVDGPDVVLVEKRPFEDGPEVGLLEKRLSEDRSEVGLQEKRSLEDRLGVGLGEKRPYEDEIGTDLVNKKASGGGNAAELARNLKKVSEIVLVLAAMGKMRAGGRPRAVEVDMMAQARGKLVEICKEFAPKDVFPTDAFETMIEDLGLDRLRETKWGLLPPKMPIVEKLQLAKKKMMFTQLAKQKMEKSEVYPLHSATHAPRVTEPRATPHAVQTMPSGKADHAPISTRSFQNSSSMAHASPTSNSRTVPHQLPTSEVRPVGSNVLTGSHLGRGSTASNANLVGDHKASHNPTWSMQSQSVSYNNAGLNNRPAHLSNINHHKQHQMNYVQPPAVNTHNEIAKIVQKILQPHMPDRHTWIPPSRDYMNKALTCQTCKSMINEIDNVLICDACEKGYHLRCLQCNPKSILGDECREWHCAKCLALSNGKPLPLKYGRVMRNININTPKRPANMSGVQPSSEKKVQSSNENFNQRLMSANGESVSQTSTDVQISGTHECGTEKLSSEKCRSNLQTLENHQNADACSKPSTQNGTELESNSKAKNGKNEVNGGNIVKTSENCTSVRENEASLMNSMHDVEWVGGVINEIDGKMYYGSFCINGTTYKLQDYALFSSTGDNLTPNKLQSMWEDMKTHKKWVTVTRCFFPDDLPEGVGRPCAPESNEVYESNHETTLAAGLINGPCQVLHPRKFSEEKEIQTQFQTNVAFDKPDRLFLCKWFYDEKKHLFRDVTC